jgi:DNA-binding transcriptional LysR family regulator
MNIVTLKTFLTVVELRNLNKAADRLHVTQSTVSARIDALEASLGQQLMVRSRKGAALTKAGFALQRYAENIVQTWERGQQAIKIPEGYEASISISCEHDLWQGSVEPWLDEMTKKHADLAIEIWPGHRSEIEAWLNSGLVDAAITREPLAGKFIATKPFQDDKLVHVRGSNSNPNAKFIMVDHGPEFRRQFTHNKLQARFTFGKGGSVWALNKILKDNYSGYLPEQMVNQYLHNGELIQVPDSMTYATTSHLSWRTSVEEDLPWVKG